MHSLSVIIPVYNTAQFLPDCLNSILVRNTFDGEVICIDDGSTDSSVQVLQQYASRYQKLRIITQTNQRQGAARNVGIEAAQNDYILMVDSDDMVAEGAIDRILGLIENEDVVYFQTCYFDQKNHTQGVYRHRSVAKKMNGRDYFEHVVNLDDYTSFSPVAFYRRSFLYKHNIRFIPGVYHEDHAWVAHLLCQAHSITSLNEPLYIYRIREGSTMHSITLSHCQDRLTVAANIIEFCQNHHWFPKKMRQFVWNFDYWDAIEHSINNFYSRRSFFTLRDWQRMWKCCTSSFDRRITFLALFSFKASIQYKNYLTPHLLRKLYNFIIH